MKTGLKLTAIAAAFFLTGCLQTQAIKDEAPKPEPALAPVVRLDEPVIGPDGISHEDCYVEVGVQFSTVTCADGFTEQS